MASKYGASTKTTGCARQCEEVWPQTACRRHRCVRPGERHGQADEELRAKPSGRSRSCCRVEPSPSTRRLPASEGQSGGDPRVLRLRRPVRFRRATSSLSSKNLPYDGVQTAHTLNSCLVTDPELSGYTYSVNELRTAYGLDSLPAGPKVAKAARVVILAEGDGFRTRRWPCSPSASSCPRCRSIADVRG